MANYGGSFANQFKKLMDAIATLRSPQIMERMPEVEAMSFDERVAFVKKGDATLHSMLKSWDKLKAILVAKGMPVEEAKRYRNNIKRARGHLANALRLSSKTDVPAPFHGQAEQGINIVTAWFIGNMGYFEDLLRGRVLKANEVEAEAQRVLPEYTPEKAADPAPDLPDAPDLGDHAEVDGIVEANVDAGANARKFDGDTVDVIDEAGASHVM